jgi:hypothetical protein
MGIPPSKKMQMILNKKKCQFAINTMRNKHKDGDLISRKERNWSLNPWSRPSAETQALLRVAANVVTFGAAISAISAAKVCLETGHSQKRII